MPDRAATNVTSVDGCSSRFPVSDVGSLDALRERLPRPDQFVQTAELFRLLGDPTRMTILHALAEGGELCVCDLAAVVGVSENVVSQAMRLLRAADVVRTRRDGRRIHYRLADTHVRILLDVSVDHVGHAGHGDHQHDNADDVPGREMVGRRRAR